MRLLSIILILSLFFHCKSDDQKQAFGPNTFFCDAEQLSKEGSQFISFGNEFNGGAGQTSDEAYEGKYSCLVDKNHKYGFTYIFKELVPGECFNITVRRKSANSKGILVAQSVKEGIYKHEQYSFQKKDENGWDVLAMKIQLPMNVDSLEGLKIYVFNADEEGESAYFDNLKIHRYQRTPSEEPIGNNVMSIQLADNDLETLMSYRDLAVAKKVIAKKWKKNFDGMLNYNGKRVKIEIRLKGDWTDHLEGDKWSYRIKVKGGETIMGVKAFSIQNPTIRDFLNEWVIHELCRHEDLLTTKYEYVPVVINGVNFGLYNFEEHFEKQLVESKDRREGVILKFSEDGFWEDNLVYMATKEKTSKPFYQSSTIVPFKEKKTFKTPKLEHQFLIAQNLMKQYKNGEDNIENYMDIDRLAKAYALMDLGNIEHAYAWHNQRFYYNPITSKLELITYDCYSTPGESLKRPFSIKGNGSSGLNVTVPHEYCLKSVFDDDEFLKRYLTYLKKYSSEAYLKNAFKSLSPKIDSLNKMIQNEYEYYFYDDHFLANNAKKIREKLPEYEEKVKNNTIKYALLSDIKNECILEKPLKHISLNAHIQEVKPSGAVELSLINYHCGPIKVIGYEIKALSDSLLPISSPITLTNYPTHKKETLLSIKEIPKKLFYQVVGTNDDSIYSVKVIRWPRPTGEVAYEKMMSETLNPSSKIYTLKDQSITFKKGVHQISNNIIIPEDYLVTFEPGTELIFNKGTFFMSYSAVQMTGTQEQPITIRSTDGTGNGFTVLQAADKSTLNYVVFDGLNTFDKFGWTLTGAVTFFESEVEIKNSVFTNNVCEDGLNIVHSKFKLSKSEVSNTFSDGFDADFCEGEVINSTFANTGNDCLDFSTSTITVSNVEISQSGDKGVSCGEASNITLTNITIDGAVIGVASKDNSTTLINSISIANSGIGFSAFQKKPEYGPSSIEVKEHTVNNVGKLTETDEDSKIKFNKKEGQAL